MMKRLSGIVIVWFCLTSALVLSSTITLAVQETGGAPTLVPPTLVPTVDPGVGDVLVSESGVARIQRDGRVRVGILYNARPFGELNIRGEVSGYDADLARGLAKAWGVEIEFIQVTRQTALDALRTQQVDLLVAAQVHRRELDAQLEFSHTYYVDSQSMMVRADDGATVLEQMANRKVGVIIGTSGEKAVAAWLQRTRLPVTVQTYLTLDQAFVALMNQTVDGVVDSRVRLTSSITQLDRIRILEESVAPEPYAIAMLRQDVSLRNLVNRTLQYLVKSGDMGKIYQASFPGLSFPDDLIPLWGGIGDEAPKPEQFAPDITYPAQYITPRILSEKVLRVSGVSTLPEGAAESQRRLDAFNRAVVESMASRWGARIEYLPESAASALDLVASGEADLALGVQPDWSWADRVDFTGPYLLHGQRLMVQKDSNITDFTGLRGGKWVAIINSELELKDRALELANSVNARIEIYQTREQDVAVAILQQDNADVAFGDSLKLIPYVQAYPDVFQLTDRWYSHAYVSFAVPRNDIDFRLLVEYTLQEMVRDRTLQTLAVSVMLPEDMPRFDIWPGSSNYLGLSLGS